MREAEYHDDCCVERRAHLYPSVSRCLSYRSERDRPHRITSSARCITEVGIFMPKALAVRMLITNSNFIGRWIGKSPGLAPFRILSTYTAERRRKSSRS